MHPSRKSSAPDTPHESKTLPVERRSRFRGNLQFDLCNVLEVVRRRYRLGTIALSDRSGIVVAGAGRFSVCEELCARAASAQAEQKPREISVGGERLLLAALERNSRQSILADEAMTWISDACARILGGHSRKALSGLIG